MKNKKRIDWKRDDPRMQRVITAYHLIEKARELMKGIENEQPPYINIDLGKKEQEIK